MPKPTIISLQQLEDAVRASADARLVELTERESRDTSAGAIVTDPTTMGYMQP